MLAEKTVGLYRAIVTDNRDPESLLRIKVQVPQLFGMTETDWLPAVVPVAVGVTTPNIGDPVWVGFEAGDINRPVWMGIWYAYQPGGARPNVNFGGVVSETTYGQAPSNGTAQTLARSDHTHGSPSLTVSAPTAIQPDDTAAVGSGSVPARTDHRHAIVTAAPGSSAPSDTPAEGTSTAFSRADHVHGRESPPAEADQTMMWMVVAP
jgi:hypothetical protein